MEEQWLLTCLIRPSCPKCPKRHYEIYQDDTTVGDELDTNWSDPEVESNEVIRGLKRRRTDDGAQRARRAAREQLIDEDVLKELGFHSTEPFSSSYPFNGILDAVGPNLLHGISKCFMDDLLKKWVIPLVKKWWKDKGYTSAEVEEELNSRFALMPRWKNVRRFKSGILGEGATWMVHDYKAMMAVIIGVLQ